MGASSPQIQRMGEALQRIRSASLLLIIAGFMMSLGALTGALSMLRLGFADLMSHLFVGSFAAAIAMLVGAVITFIAFYSYLRPGALMLREADQRYSTAATLIDIGYFWGLILLIIGIPLLLIVIGVVLLIIGAILLLIGKIGVIILAFNLHDAEKNTLYLVAGILFIIGIFVELLTPIAWILMYIALGGSIERHTQSMSASPQVSMV
ncbi:protein of unknown function (DUF996) [Ignisphaera aggregans DSM 17230]|uniref:DUF973 family protein n=1 Tax=Ignisphaera aggregans (strain DSM 17230 / JCM 13409 / AQ1.S1) TaxID=583356 RepID=E0SP18_IGNAA|nr:protein of unknown function (DUF996) [Ignisphaera aggregans DSM 17230]